jgi:tetratricopeptide (TPR) repeat protein
MIITLVAIPAMIALAQEAETTPEPDALSRAEAAAARAEAAAARAEEVEVIATEAAEEAAGMVDLAGGLFGLFEAMSGAVGLVVPVLAVLAGLVGFRRLESAQNELREARERFERDMKLRETELDQLRDDLKSTMQRQRENAARASVALSLLPLGERQYKAQDYTGALDTYRRALALDPDNPIIHYRMGYVYTQAGQLEEAARHLNRSLELDPEFGPSIATRGYVYRRTGDKMPAGIERDLIYNKAEENFLQALERSPKLVDEDGEPWWGALGGLYRRRGQVEQAIRAYERATEIAPHSSYPFSNLALLYAQTHNRARMLETYARVEKLAIGEVQAEVDNYYAYADLVVARIALGKFKEVEDILETALRTAPVDSTYPLDLLVETLDRLLPELDNDHRPQAVEIRQRILDFRAQRESQKFSAAD